MTATAFGATVYFGVLIAAGVLSYYHDKRKSRR